jgi:histone H3/H4
MISSSDNGKKGEVAPRADLESFENILSSMGIDKYDPEVLPALEEFARRFAVDILCDARDYANHAGRSDIDVKDVKLAVKLSGAESATTGELERAVNDAKDQINKIPLGKIIDETVHSIRYAKDRLKRGDTAIYSHAEKEKVQEILDLSDPVTGLLQRTYTLVPGNQAYSEVTVNELENDGNMEIQQDTTVFEKIQLQIPSKNGSKNQTARGFNS